MEEIEGPGAAMLVHDARPLRSYCRMAAGVQVGGSAMPGVKPRLLATVAEFELELWHVT